MKMPPKVIIIGRPNVGKSTLFNRLYGRKRALVHDLPGVTRDRLEEKTLWYEHGKAYSISLVDTGGLGGEKFADEIERQVDTALKQADVVLFLFDAQSGLTPQDEEVLNSVRRSGLKASIPVIGVVNKVDAEKHETLITDFYATGIEKIHTVSAEHNRGIDDLKLDVLSILREEDKLGEAQAIDQDQPQEEEIPKIAIVGRPNVGKSTLVNALLQEERMITSPMAGTTIDAVDSSVLLNDKPFILVDTAGIRRKDKTEKGVEVLSVVQARKALDRCDVALLVLDGEHGITDQDEKIGGLIEDVGCSVVLVVNKWDLQQRTKFTKEMAAENIRKQMAYLKYAPLMFVSAQKQQGFDDLGDLLEEILNQRRVKVGTHEFTEWVRQKAEIHNPKNAKFYLCHQSGRHPPTFVCHVSDPEKIDFSLKRHLLNGIRERWGYMGSPLRMVFVKGKNNQRSTK